MRRVAASLALAAVLLAAAPVKAQDGGSRLLGIDVQNKYGALRYALILVAGTVEYCRALGALKERRTEDALDRLHAAARFFNANAKLRLARMYRSGEGVPADREEALLWYLQLADSGHALAQFELAALIEAGARGVPDREGALHWYRKAAEGGDRLAQRRLALLYAAGQWVGRDFAEARRWFALAAARADADSQLALGRMLMRGEGGPPDPDAGAEWLRLAAAAGNPEAMLEFGRALTHPSNPAPDRIEASLWLGLAAARLPDGHDRDDAIRRLERLTAAMTAEERRTFARLRAN